MSFYIKVNPEQLPEQLKTSSALLELNPFSHRMAFISNEVFSRGFFSENNLSQISNEQLQLPLLTWPFLDFITSIDMEKLTLIELGSGNSTLWFAKKFKNIISYETNIDWYDQIKNKAPDNCLINFISEPELVEENIIYSSTDWLLIDFGGRRTQFINNMLKRENQNLPAVIILDNSDWYRRGAGLLHDQGFIEIPFFGFKSGQMHLSCTSIFLKNTSALKRKSLDFVIPKYCITNTTNAWDLFTN